MQEPTNASAFFARFPLAVKCAIRTHRSTSASTPRVIKVKDYYNIWYDRFISVLQIGLSGNLSTGLGVYL